jgi:hypothetical protein
MNTYYPIAIVTLLSGLLCSGMGLPLLGRAHRRLSGGLQASSFKRWQRSRYSSALLAASFSHADVTRHLM